MVPEDHDLESTLAPTLANKLERCWIKMRGGYIEAVCEATQYFHFRKLI
jgi:hypothetical protein